jgi:uncharacterized protein
MFAEFVDRGDAGEVPVRGFLDSPVEANGGGFVLTHGAGADSRSKLLMGMADALVARGFVVLRFDLPFRQERPHGPPPFGSAAGDREGIRRAITAMRKKVAGRVYAGGHSYGGRQATIVLAEEPQLADGLLLLSYPLHPPRKPQELRVHHFPKVETPAFFVHGTGDPFGSIDEIKSAIKLIPARHALLEIEGAGHDLVGKGGSTETAARVANAFEKFIALSTNQRLRELSPG